VPDPETAGAPVDVGVAMAALEGEPESGDLHLVAPFRDGLLVAAVDGLGHGPEAAHAARVAGSELERDAGAPLTTLFERCHRRLAKTRGVVLSAASFNTAEGTLTWLGVGNVEGALVRAEPGSGAANESILLMGGVLGYQLPRLRPSTLSLVSGDTLVFATDGISSGFVRLFEPGLPPQLLADRILAEHSRMSDDALVVVARYSRESR